MPTISVMTYNMLHAPGDRYEELARVIENAKPDVLACQEVDDLSALLSLSHRLGMMPVIGHCNRPESEPAPEHLAILSRFPVTEVMVHPGDMEAMFRPVLEVWIKPPQFDPIGFFNVHFRAFPGEPCSQVKMREMAVLLDVLSKADGPHCALGDFNAWAPGEGDNSPSWAPHLPDDHREAVRGGVIEQILNRNYTDTWLQVNQPVREPANTLRGKNSRVDFIWADSSLAPFAAGSEIIRTPLTEIASDHYPVLTRFDLP